MTALRITAPRVTVIGGGVIGLSLAWELSRRCCEVILVDRGHVARGTSWTAAGILPPANLATATDPLDRLRGLSHQLYPRWSRELLEQTGIDVELTRCGGWYLADSIGERAAMLGMQGYWEELAIDCQQIPLGDLPKREPVLTKWASESPDRAAWWVPDEYQVRPPRLLSALVAGCEVQGVEIRDHSPVTDLKLRSSGVRIVGHNDHWDSDQVVVCSGAWTGRIANTMQLQRAIVPVRGQMLLLKTPEPVVGPVVNVGNRYVVARRDGHVLVGSCEEEVGYELETDRDTLDELAGFAGNLIPELKAADRVRAWSGLRPMTFDGFPMIGPVPKMDNVYVASGHYRSGIHLAPATAVLLANEMLETAPEGNAESTWGNLEAFRVGKQQYHPNPDAHRLTSGGRL